uniref:3b protein n=1 Tax=Bacopa chlorosis virus TaxID=593888 RepID=H9BG07_9BROM|nr:3b protein [Bacopa chlorosis virus]UOF93188.1 coat protein [Bacopa chlorosis virus]UOF93190.1 coat protein [Bacopa chlorosis virus]WIW79882.1 coat protein [Bacopa chlorosis virus]
MSSQRNSGQETTVSNRQRRNARRAASFRNSQAAARVPLPVPVVPTGPISVIPASRSQGSKSALKLPNSQVWVCKAAAEWGAKTTDANDAIPIKTMFSGIPEIKPETKFFRLIIGFVAESDGSFGVVDDENVASNVVPDPPVVGRVGFKKHTYKCRDINLEGKTPDELKHRAVVWCLEDNRKVAKRVMMTHYWFAISRPPPLMPPENILVDGNSLS